MNHFYSYILYKGLSEDFAIWRKEQKRLSHNLAMKKYRKQKRDLAKQGISINNGNVFHHTYFNDSKEITVKDVTGKHLSLNK